MDRFHALTAFARVVETGSFARAAERLGVSVSSVSRLVADLEAHLDARLLNRTTRRLSLTESGQAFFERCVQLLADLEEAEVAVTAASIVPRGTLRLTCSATFGARHLAPAIAAFAARHPQMRFDVELSERMVDLVEEGFDLAVRVGETGSQNLVGRRIGTTRLVCCAAPSYLARHGEPREPEDLARHACLTYEYAPNRNVWTFRDGKGGERQVRIAGPDPRQQRALQRGARGGGPRHRARAGLHRRSRRARRPAEADTAALRAAAAQHLRRVPEPAAPVGEGPGVRRFPRRALRDGAMEPARGRPAARQRRKA